MSTTDTSILLGNLRLPWHLPKTDYKEKLKRLASLATDASEDIAVLQEESSYARQVRTLSRHPDAEAVAFQCVAAAALQTLEQVLYCERRAARAAISLAQQDKLNEMVDMTAAAVDALRATLTAQGRHTLRPTPDRAAADEQQGTSWWFALSEALAALEEGATWIRSVAAGQPRGSAAHTLSSVVSRLLHDHHQTVFAEAEHWMS